MLDAASDRLSDNAHADFETRVEAARMGFIFAQGRDGQRQYDRWRRRSHRQPGTHAPAGGLTGGALELHISSLKFSRPDLVKVN